jgi:dTDP-4-amino-4,6-dideoxygalactose transaminase
MTYYARRTPWTAGAFPNAERIADQSIALPVGPHLDPDDMVYIAGALKDVLKDVRA